MNRKLAHVYQAPDPRPRNRCRRRSLRPGPGLPGPALHPIAEPRLLCSDLVTLGVSEPGLALREVGAVLEEISTHSACVQFEESVPVETSVRFLSAESAEGGNLTGTVVQCLHEQDLGFFAEIRFNPGCTWSAKRYRPLHLFDTSSLLAARETVNEA